MIRNDFNELWQVSEKGGSFGMQTSSQPVTVTLPYDAMIHSQARSDATGGFKTGYFQCGAWEYKKKFYVPVDSIQKKILFQFDGVYKHSMVYINGGYAGGRPNGYAQFFIDANRYLRYGADNEIKVIVRTADDERWYPGAGIYRDVYMLTADLLHIEPQGLKVTTPHATNSQATVCTAICLKNDSASAIVTVQIITEIYDADGRMVASDKAPVTIFQGESATLRQRMYVYKPKLWNVEEPNLYTCKTRICDDNGSLLDECAEAFGIRSLTLDVENGLSINGKSVKLRGACIHHDNGPIGAVSTDAAEERRIVILKQSGFNAIRTAHNPASPALLRACDKLGILVMEEAFDTWTVSKTDFDYALDFPAWWENDLKAMVGKSYNHPCVVLYSIGNEIPDTGSPNGSALGRKLAEKLRSLDCTRFITNGINGMVSVMELLNGMRAESESKAENGEINNAMTNLGEMMRQIMSLEAVTNATAESFAHIDIAGYNYMDARYETDRELFPNRIICGTETFPADIDRNWRKVMDLGHVIGDFTWTGWDYLGEAGIGQVRYAQESITDGVYGAYPSLTSMSGDISISGFRRPVSYYRQIVFGLRKEPYIAVQRPVHYHNAPIASPWSWSDSVCSWSWQGYEGKPVKIEVYSDAEEVELLLNGKSLDRQATGEKNRYRAIFEATYQPGELIAIAYTDGIEQGRFSLESAVGNMLITTISEREQVSFNTSDLAYINIFLTDANGNIFTAKDRKIQISIEGPGELLGFGTDDPNATENFFDKERTTFDGRALAVIRPTGEGEVVITVNGVGLRESNIHLSVI
ncbi:MAG: DUF4982 domain-containing protein [Clostridiales bacterium]|jgi:beta-galactosidase|nr:DUF4982 domain-containing protein [Clostridiales bacterium]